MTHVPIRCLYRFFFYDPIIVLRYSIQTKFNIFSQNLVDEIQVASYKILSSLYTLGTDPSLNRER